MSTMSSYGISVLMFNVKHIKNKLILNIAE